MWFFSFTFISLNLKIFLLIVFLQKELDKDIHTLATVLEDAKSNAGEDTIGKVTGALGELKVLSCAFDTRLDLQYIHTS